MADTVRSVAHFTIDIENSVGSGAKILGDLRDNDVDFIAAWGYAISAHNSRDNPRRGRAGSLLTPVLGFKRPNR